MATRSFATTTPKILFHNVNDQGGGQFRCIQPASLMRRYGYAVSQVHPHPVAPKALEVLDPDVIVFQMFQTEQQVARIKAYRKTLPQCTLVYEIDDLFWAVPEDSFHRANPLLATSKSNIRTAAKMCDVITVTTPALAEEMKKLTGMRDIRVVPNKVPKAFINAALDGRRSSDAKRTAKPRIGWAGGIGHAGDLKIIAEIMRSGQWQPGEVRWVFLGMLPPGIQPSEDVEFYPGVPFADYPRLLGTLNLDLALAPLEDNDFNRCKSDLRILEYGAAGFPVIASNIATYHDCPVMRANNTPGAWIDVIRGCLASSSTTEAYAEKLHEWVISTQCLDDHIQERTLAYLPKNQTIFTPMAAVSHIGEVVTVGVSLADLPNFRTVAEAWKGAPGADILYVRPGTILNAHQAARLIHLLGKHSSATPVTNDGMYPVWQRYVPAPPEIASQIDQAALLANHEPILCPFPSGPCVLLAGSALARFGLPDETRFGSLEYAMADWGARCMEGGGAHITVPTVYVATASPLVQTQDVARRTLEHISMWTPGVVNLLQTFQEGDAFAAVREDLDLAVNAINYNTLPIDNYPLWHDLFDAVTEEDRHIMSRDIASWKEQPHINVVVPVYNTDETALRACLDSVINQTYAGWTLLIADDCSTASYIPDLLQSYVNKDDRIMVVMREENGHICKASNSALENAESGWVVFLDHDDLLAPQAMYMFAREILQHPSAQLIYSDSDKIDPSGKLKDPYFTPDFSYELLLAQNYVTHLCAYRLDVVQELGGMKPGTEGSQDWDLVLRYLERTCGNPPDRAFIRHIPAVLYHWREGPDSTAGNVMAKPYALEAGRKAVMDHLHRLGQPAFIGQNPIMPIFNMIRFLVPDPAPKVTVIIPTKDNAGQLDRCLGSLLEHTAYGNYDIMVLDNGSTDVRTTQLLRRLPEEKRRHIRVLRMPGKFNFADMNNRAVKQTDAEFVCLMNDDIETLGPSWLNDMVGLAMRPGVGAVGPKLLYPNNTVQQFGTMCNAAAPVSRRALHLWQGIGMNDLGQAARAVITQPFSAVTAACLLVHRGLYEVMGGLDAVRFPVDFNDVDFCLRLGEAGYRNIACAEALMRHHEGQTKKRIGNWDYVAMAADEDKLWELHPIDRDPYVNPNLTWTPELNQLARVPLAKPWRTEPRTRELLINPTHADMEKSFKEWHLPFGATTEGHYLMLAQPRMPNVRPVDLRLTIEQFEILATKLGVTDVVFCGIGDGTLGVVGYFATVAEHGWPVRIQLHQEVNTGNELQYYDPTGWRNTWSRLLDATFRGAAAVKADTEAAAD